jgi:hypothetical protein
MNFYNILTIEKRDPSREFVSYIFRLYNQRIIDKKQYIRQELEKLGIQDESINRVEQKIKQKELIHSRLKQRINRLKTKNYINIENEEENKRENMLIEENQLGLQINQMRESIQLILELKTPFLFEDYGLTLNQFRRMNIIKGLKKYQRLLSQLIDFYPQAGNLNRKMRIREAFKGRIEEQRGRPLPTPEQIRNNQKMINQLRREYLNPLRDQEYGAFLDLKRGHLKYEEREYTTIQLFSLMNTKNSVLSDLRRNIYKIENEEEFIQRLGIHQLRFNKRAIAYDGSTIELIQRYFIYWIKELLLPIQINLQNQQDMDLYLTYNDYVLLNLQFYLLYIVNETHIKNGNSEEYKRGSWGAPFRINNHVYKHEHLRHRELNTFSKRKLYPYYNYQMTVYFIGYMVQHYCYSHFPRYIPKPNKITFDLDRNISETNMNVASKYNNGRVYTYTCNLGEFFEKPCIYKRRDFTSLFFKILKEISKMLMDMQEKIGFVHYDFHSGNIIINYRYSNELTNENNNPKNDVTIDFELKIIDLLFSSVLIQNKNQKIYMLKYTNFQIYRNPNILNPLYHNFNKVYDLLYYLFSILFHVFLIKKKENTYYNFRRYETIFQKIKEIYNFKEDYLILYKNKFEKISVKTAFIMLSDVNIFREILGTNVNLQYFIPSELYQYFISNPI